MNRPTLIIGALIIAAMCLVPPFRAGPMDKVSDMLEGETIRTVEYHPVWTQFSPGDDGPLSDVQNGEIAWNRLLLQILGVALATGGIAYVWKS
ncbi:MAG: hypothetical protein BRD55_08665 [Bacteroidetes bacterium SW_9_63_38]|nr:MAG: hypothetical protein BRD55_08665 [Bacteroidetes bacterium SW_9_63_38]